MAKKIKQRHPPLFCFLYGSDCSVSTPPQAVMNCFFHNPPTAARFPNPSRRGLQEHCVHVQIPPTAARFPNPSRRGLQACFAHSQIPCVKGAVGASRLRDCFFNTPTAARFPNPSRRGLFESIRAAGAPLLFDLLSYLFSQKSRPKAAFFILCIPLNSSFRRQAR